MSNPNTVKQQNALIVSEEVVCKIAGVAAKDVEGVVGLASKPVEVKGLFRRKDASKSVVITVSNGAMILDVYVSLAAGAKIPEVCANIQESVKSAVQNITDKPVAKVNVTVCDVEFEAE